MKVLMKPFLCPGLDKEHSLRDTSSCNAIYPFKRRCLPLGLTVLGPQSGWGAGTSRHPVQGNFHTSN